MTVQRVQRIKGGWKMRFQDDSCTLISTVCIQREELPAALEVGTHLAAEQFDVMRRYNTQGRLVTEVMTGKGKIKFWREHTLNGDCVVHANLGGSEDLIVIKAWEIEAGDFTTLNVVAEAKLLSRLIP